MRSGRASFGPPCPKTCPNTACLCLLPHRPLPPIPGLVAKNQPRGDILSALAVLDREERAISALRRDLHDQIDTLYLTAPLDKEQITKLDLLESQARDVSARRRALHRKIDELRVQAGQQAFRRGERPTQPHRVYHPE